MDNISLEHQQLNSCFNFIRPSKPEESKKEEEKKKKGTFSFSNTDITSSTALEPINDNSSGRILRQIDPNPLKIIYSPPKHDDKIDDTIFHQLNFPHLKRPHISPTSSNSSSASSSPIFEQRAIAIPVNNDVADHNSPFIDKSPAASFLANFMSSIATNSACNISKQSEGPTAIDNYNLGESIGFGGFSTVRKAHHIQTGQVVAVKIIQQQLMNELSLTRLDRELSIWKSLDHPNIVHLQKVIHMNDENTSYLFSDYCNGGNLLNYLNEHKQIDENNVKSLFKELCQGIYYLHVDRRVCHKDLKLENILLDDNDHIKICDFGLAIEISHIHHRHSHKKTRKQDSNNAEELVGGSLAYAAPEQIRQKTPLICPKTDIWSLGVILYTLAVGSLPFMDDYSLRLQQKILEGHFEIPENIGLSEPLKELIFACLAYEPDKRFDINQILQSKWLNI
jgi:hypothetical protein